MPPTARSFRRDVSTSTVVAGFVAVLVGYTSSVVIVFQAARAFDATPAQTTSWLWALGLGMGLTSIALSLPSRQPVLTAWSTPGAALLATTSGFTMPEAVGAFIACALLMIVAGATRAFERVMNRIPMALASALLAGVLTRFALDAVVAARDAPVLVLLMAVALVLGRLWWPRYAVPGVLAVGVVIAAWQHKLQWSAVQWEWALPVWTTPQWSVPAFVGMAVPLFIVTMASQNLPGVAAQRAAGYRTAVSAGVTTTGIASLLLAPFGGYAFNFAAITAAICMSRDAHDDPARRYTAAVMAGVFYVVLGLLAGAVAGLLTAFPRELVSALAGLALLGTIGASLNTALSDESHRDAALLTFLVTLSGVVVAGVGSAFWGVVAGAAVLGFKRLRR
jgi:benzoate membrane transport protein